MFNRHSSFYKAETVVLVSVKSPSLYCCIILPVDVAEKAAQMTLAALESHIRNLLIYMAGTRGLEPAASAVTGNHEM